MKRIFTKILLAICCISLLVGAVTANLSVAALADDAIPTGTPTVDGTIDDVWEYASNKIDIKTLSVGSEADNANGWARLMWDNEAIYVLGYITDKTPSNNLTGDPWNTDSFEFFLNEQNKQVEDFKWIDQFRADRDGRFSGMIAHVISTEAQYKRTFPGIQWASKAVEGSTDYVVEFKVPWKKIEAKSGTKIGVAFQINDDYNNDGDIADGVTTNEVIDTFNPKAHTVMKLASTKAEVPKGDTASKNETATESSASSKNDTSSKAETVSKTESAVEENKENDNTSDESTVNDGTATTEKEDENTVVTTVTETVNQKLLNTVIIASAAAVLLVAIICATVIIIVYKKKN